MYFAEDLTVVAGANYMSREFIYFETTKSDVACVGSL